MTDEQKTSLEWYEEGNRRLSRGDLASAMELFQKALAVDPDYADAHNKLGVVFAEQGDKQSAREQFTKALSINERHASALTNLGNLYFLDNDLTQAEQCHRQAIQCDPDNPVAHNNLAAVLKKQRRISEFVEEVKKAQRLARAEDTERVKMEAKAGPSKGRSGCLGSVMLMAIGLAILVVAVSVL